MYARICTICATVGRECLYLPLGYSVVSRTNKGLSKYTIKHTKPVNIITMANTNKNKEGRRSQAALVVALPHLSLVPLFVEEGRGGYATTLEFPNITPSHGMGGCASKSGEDYFC